MAKLKKKTVKTKKPVKKSAVKKSAAKKVLKKKTVAKKVAPKKTALKKAAAKKMVKKTFVKKPVAKKRTAKKPVAKKLVVKKAVAGKPAIKKTAPKKTAPLKVVSPKAATPKAAAPKATTPQIVHTGPKGIPEQLLDAALKVLDERQAEDIVTVRLAGRSTIADYMIIASGRAARQVAAIADHLREAFFKLGIKQVRIEGQQEANWVLVDAGDVIIHLFRPEVRSYYDLDAIWKKTQGQ